MSSCSSAANMPDVFLSCFTWRLQVNRLILGVLTLDGQYRPVCVRVLICVWRIFFLVAMGYLFNHFLQLNMHVRTTVRTSAYNYASRRYPAGACISTTSKPIPCLFQL